jgi:sialic acid synthase SpsE
MKTIRIGERLVGEGQPCFIIAEAGVNHNGEVELARRLVDVAVRAQADAVKFQKRTITDILVRAALDAPYVRPSSLGATYGEHREKLELPEDAYWELVDHCRKRDITFLASAWDPKSADFVDELGVPAFKIASADLTNLPLLDHIARKNKPILLSTGMSEMDEIADAVATVRRHHDQLVLLQCTSAYPCDNADLNLRAMETLRRAFDVPVGYSGHERGLSPTEAAVALGAVVVERHFTLDRTLPGPDHAASLEPRGLELLVRNVRNVETALGSSTKRVLPAERPVRDRLAKSVVAARDIAAGARLEASDLTVKGPGTGISPRFLGRLIGRTVPGAIAADTLLPPEALEWP